MDAQVIGWGGVRSFDCTARSAWRGCIDIWYFCGFEVGNNVITALDVLIQRQILDAGFVLKPYFRARGG